MKLPFQKIIFADLMDSPEKITDMIKDRVLYQKLMWILYAFGIAVMLFSQKSDTPEISRYLILIIAFYLTHKNKTELQLLHIVRKITDAK